MLVDVETSRAATSIVTADLLLDPNRQPIIGHRGASGLAPENTMASFDLALAQGAEAFEFDIRLTADSVPVVFHDEILDRTTDATGPISARSLADLERIDAGARFTPDGTTFPYRGRGIRIPTLADVLARYAEVPMLVELKLAEAGGPVRQALLAAGAAGRVVVASFQPGAVDQFMQPPFQPGASRREIIDLAVRSFLRLPPRDQGVLLYAVPIRYRGWIPVPTRQFVRNASILGHPVHVWTVNDASTAEALWSVGCAGMITNYPGLLRASRDRLKG